MMNKAGVTGLGSVSGLTAAAAVAAAQKQKVLLRRVDTDFSNIIDNFIHLVNEPLVRNSQEAFMMEMRSAQMDQAADSLLKLVLELKQTAIFTRFASLNDHVVKRIAKFSKQAEQSNAIMSRILDDAATSLKELESHYYSSAERIVEPSEH